MTADIVPAASAPLATEGAAILDVIARAAKDPAVDVDKLERLLAIQERMMAAQRRTAFYAALARLQERLPQIAKSGTILNKSGAVTARFAKIEDVDTAIRPLVASEGFSFTFGTTDVGAKGTEYSCMLSHRDGHSETQTIILPPDTFSFRTGAQNAGSNVSYARRYLLGMHLNLVMRDEDDDGTGGGAAPITAEQAARLRSELAEVGADEGRFLRWAGVDAIDALPSAKLGGALRFLEEKRRVKGAGR